MPIEITCTSCSKRLRVPDNAAGKRVRCPQCKTVLSVPAAGGSSPSGVGARYHLKTEDGQVFGPVPKQELDEWLAEERITADCQILREGAEQWQWATDIYPQLDGAGQSAPGAASTPSSPSGSAAGGFPQVGPAAPTGPAPGGAPDNPFAFAAQDAAPTSRIGGARAGTAGKVGAKDPAVVAKVKGPAFALIALGVIDILTGCVVYGASLGGLLPTGGEFAAPGIIESIVGMTIMSTINVAYIFAGMQMLKLRSREIAIAASVMALIPICACCFVGLPVGIWSLIVLNSADVKAVYR